jgi:FtsP/CotA-like multicopper oxidase with cupredoxin domain/peroxiredoxin
MQVPIMALASRAQAQSTTSRTEPASNPALGARTDQSPFTGKWTYRSFRSNPNLSVPANDLLFGQGTMDLRVPTPGQLAGTLGGDGWQLTLTGNVTGGNPASIRFQGKGTVGGEEWVYDYLGYLVPPWPNGVDQRPAIVGTIVRTVPHSGGTATAGYVAQWIAVKQDQVNAPRDAATPPLPAKLGEGLRGLEREWAQAAAANNVARISRFLSDDFIFVGAGGILQSRQQHLDDFRTGRLKLEAVNVVDDATVHMYREFAVVNTLAKVKGKLGDRDISGNYRFMDTWRFADGRWLAVARQQTRAPDTHATFAAPTGNAQQPTPYQRLLREMYLNAERKNVSPDSNAAPRALPRHGSSSLQPPTLRSANGRLDVTLEVRYETVRIGNHDVRLRTYNGRLIGPILRVKAGDTLYITLVNKLPAETDDPHPTNGHHAWNTTNLHFHGLHVAPQGTPNAESDNVLLELKPNADPSLATQRYAVHIPANHVAGTFWYHAHKHGAVAAQVSSGLAGALIIERDDNLHNLDSVPAIAAAAEEVIVLQEIPYLKPVENQPGFIERSPDTDPAPNQAVMFGPGQWPVLKRYVTVNGEKIPTITVAPGEVRRLRFVDSAQRESMNLRVERAPQTTGTGPDRLKLYEIAVDGLPTGRLREVSETQTLELFPGYRSDVLIQPPPDASGVYYLVDTRWDVNGQPRPDTGADGSPEPLRWVLKIVVTGAPRTMNLPTEAELRPHRLTDLQPAAVTGTQRAFYGLYLPANAPIGFFVSRSDLSQSLDPVSPANAKAYDPTDPRLLTLGKTERWLVGSRNDGANVTHPFHIHTNPFLITRVTSLVEPGSVGTPVDVTAREITAPTWRDTLAMKQGYTYELLTRYDDYTGDFVDHCHILDHEDNGMMELVRLADPRRPFADVLQGATYSKSGPNRLRRTVPVRSGVSSVLLFVKGSFCQGCMAQLADMARALEGRDLSVTVISASSEADLRRFPDVAFDLVADPEHRLFKQYGFFDGAARHGTVVLDPRGKELLRETGDEPFMDAQAILARLGGKGAAPRGTVALRGGFGTVPAADTPPCQCFPTPTVARVRKNIDCLTDHELEVLKHAFRIVMDRSEVNPDDPKGYAWQVRIHGDRRVGPCQHNSELIWPWHRAFLYYFESLLRDADPNHPTLSTKDLTLPYWDWTKPPSGQEGYPKAYEDRNSPLYYAGRNQWGPTKPPPLITDAAIGLQLNQWYLFGGSTTGPGQLEFGAHNEGHSDYVGGDMAAVPTSVRDPIFWAHHANLDRLWDIWQQKYKQNPVQQTTALRGWDASVSPLAVVSNFNDIRVQLKYDYCSPPPTQQLQLALPTPGAASREGGPSTLTIPFRPADLTQAQPAARSSIAQVRLKGVKVPLTGTYQVRVFLHPASAAAQPNDPAFTKRYLAGQFTMLKMGPESPAEVPANTPTTHAKTVDVNLDVTPRYEELTRQLPANTNLAVSFAFYEVDKGQKRTTAYGRSEIEFGSAALVVNPKGP